MRRGDTRCKTGVGEIVDVGCGPGDGVLSLGAEVTCVEPFADPGPGFVYSLTFLVVAARR